VRRRHELAVFFWVTGYFLEHPVYLGHRGRLRLDQPTVTRLDRSKVEALQARLDGLSREEVPDHMKSIRDVARRFLEEELTRMTRDARPGSVPESR